MSTLGIIIVCLMGFGIIIFFFSAFALSGRISEQERKREVMLKKEQEKEIAKWNEDKNK